MRCIHCGREIEDDNTFCPFCGKELFLLSEIEQHPPRRKWPLFLCIAVLVVAGGVGAYFFVNHNAKTTIDLTKNLTIEDLSISGKDGSGVAVLEDEVARARADYDSTNEKVVEYMKSVTYVVTPSKSLENGDKIIVVAKYSSETAKKLKIMITGAEKEFTVSGLKEVPASSVQPETPTYTNNAYDSEYDYPDLATRYYSAGDLEYLSKDEVQDMINEIYARHGYAFKNPDVRARWEQKSWYYPAESDMAKIEKTFNEYEKKNLALLQKYR